MSMEETIRNRHKLEDRVTRFLDQIDACTLRIKTMETRTIEICMARLYDLMEQTSNDSSRLDLLFKGVLVKLVYDQRKTGESKKIGFWVRQARSNEIIQYEFEYPVPITETLANEWGHGGESSVRKLLTM